MYRFEVILIKRVNFHFSTYFRPGRGKEERTRWDPVDHEHVRVRHNSGSHSQPPIPPPHLPNTPQRMPPNYEGRDRASYNAGDAERWRDR